MQESEYESYIVVQNTFFIFGLGQKEYLKNMILQSEIKNPSKWISQEKRDLDGSES